MRLVIAPAARDDLDAVHSYIASDNSVAADRVLDAVFETFTLLTQTPHLGRPRRFQFSLLADLRSFGVSGYPNFVIFHRVREDVIEIVRVLHGAQDFDGILGGE